MEPDSGAHGRLALLNDRRDGFPVFRANLGGPDEVIDQLVDGFPAIACF
jgi:hypothetical protein